MSALILVPKSKFRAVMPKYEYSWSFPLIMLGTILLARFIGTAKPTPEFCLELLFIWVLIPITFPSLFSKGPPEFPGFIAASVCITLGIF